MRLPRPGGSTRLLIGSPRLGHVVRGALGLFLSPAPLMTPLIFWGTRSRKGAKLEKMALLTAAASDEPDPG